MTQQSPSAASNEQLAEKILEIHHRVKNSFQVISSLLQMHSREYQAVPQHLVQSVISHIRSLAVVYDLVGEGVKSGNISPDVPLAELLRRIGDVVDTSRRNQLSVEAPDILFSVRGASSVSLIFTELLFNALRLGRGRTEVVVQAVDEKRADFRLTHTATEPAAGEPDFTLGKFLLESDFQTKLGIDRSNNELTLTAELPLGK